MSTKLGEVIIPNPMLDSPSPPTPLPEAGRGEPELTDMPEMSDQHR